ncbi:unnamed protein product [Boreogadus saida]
MMLDAVVQSQVEQRMPLLKGSLPAREKDMLETEQTVLPSKAEDNQSIDIKRISCPPSPRRWSALYPKRSDHSRPRPPIHLGYLLAVAVEQHPSPPPPPPPPPSPAPLTPTALEPTTVLPARPVVVFCLNPHPDQIKTLTASRVQRVRVLDTVTHLEGRQDLGCRYRRGGR